MLFDRLNNSMNSFMNVQSEADNDFLSNFQEKKEQNKNMKLLFEFVQKEIYFIQKWSQI